MQVVCCGGVTGVQDATAALETSWDFCVILRPGERHRGDREVDDTGTGRFEVWDDWAEMAFLFLDEFSILVDRRHGHAVEHRLPAKNA